MKTELCRSLELLPDVYTLDTLTPKALISGLVDKERKPVAGILKKIHNRILVIKDFTAVLSMRSDQRQQVLAQLRNAYDGKLEMGFGTLEDKITENAVFGLIAAMTPVIDNHTKTLVTMGPRCIFTRIHDPPRRQAAEAARKNLGRETEMRDEIKKAVLEFVMTRDYSKKIEISEKRCKMIDALADYTAIGRTHVITKYYGGKIVNLSTPSPEAPTRLAKQLTKLGISLAIIRDHSEITDEDYNTLKRVSKDTLIPEYQKIIDYYMDNLEESFMAYQISEEQQMHLQTTINYLEIMQSLGIIEVEDSIDEMYERGWRENIRIWSLTKYFRDTIIEAGLKE